MDIRAFVFSNTPNQCENYLYDQATVHYRKIDGADLDIQRLPGSDLYFSYNRAGCSDRNWESHLSQIRDWKQEVIGYLKANGCEKDSVDIGVYSISNGSEYLF